MKWADLKKARADIVGWRCEVCNKKGDRKTIIGHHRNGRKQQAVKVDEVELRCAECEFIAHQLDRYGNADHAEILQFKEMV